MERGKEAAVMAPEQPDQYVVLELDPVSKNVTIQQDPLKKFVRKLMGYLRECAAKTFSDMKYSVGNDLAEATTAIRALIEERCQQIEGKLFADPRILQLQADVDEMKDHFLDMETRHSQMSQTLEKVEGEVKKEAGTEIKDMRDVRRIVRDFYDDNKKSKEVLEDLMQRVDFELDQLSSRCEETTNLVNVQVRRIDQYGGRITTNEESITTLSDDIGEANIVIDKLTSTKADNSALKDLIVEVRDFGQLAEKGAEAADLVPRVASLERTRRTFDTLIEKNKQSIEALQQADTEIHHRIDGCAAAVQDVDHRAQGSLGQRYAELLSQDHLLSTRLAEAEGQLQEFGKKLRAWNSKADATDVAALRAALGNISHALKDKEEAVLFGARCLSCNRVFDDVQTEADVVDLSLERQKSLVFAEIQRALHSPKCDPAEPLNLIAVKVGRQMGIKCGAATYLGRDVHSMARGIEAVHLIPLRPATGSNADSLSTPHTSRSSSSRPNTSQSAGRGGKRVLTARGVATTSPASAVTPLALLRQKDKPKDGVMDFKYQLGDLLGRGNINTAVSLDMPAR